jgi:hypothetical protein
MLQLKQATECEPPRTKNIKPQTSNFKQPGQAIGNRGIGNNGQVNREWWFAVFNLQFAGRFVS